MLTDPTVYNETKTNFAENASAFASELSLNYTATAGLKLFEGALDMSTEIKATFSDNRKFNSKDIYGIFSSIIRTKRLRMPNYVPILKDYLNPYFVTFVNSQTPQEVVKNFGTHLLTDIILGAKLDILYKSETSSSERKSAAEFGMKSNVKFIFSLGSGVNANGSIFNSSSFSNSSLGYRTVGGDPSKGLIGEIDLSVSNSKINIGNWQSGVTHQNSSLIDFGSKDALIPIYELVTDATKKAALKAYITQYLIDGGVQMFDGNKTVPIYQFYHAAGDRFTTSNFNAVEGYEGWRKDGFDFKAFLTQQPGTVPVYLYQNESIFDRFLSTDINATWGYAGWQNIGVNFYAYKTQVPGTIPIYLYYSSEQTDRYTTSIPNITQYSGWVNQGIAFYAYPANYSN